MLGLAFTLVGVALAFGRLMVLVDGPFSIGEQTAIR